MMRPLMILSLIVLAAGCGQDENERWARQLEMQAMQQAEQAKMLAESQAEVAEGARHLAETNAEARRDWVELQSQLELARHEIIRGQDSLEAERRDLAEHRRLDPVIAEAILRIGGLAMCLVPLFVLAWVLRRPEIASLDQEITDLLISDLARDEPRLLPSPDPPARLPGR